MAAKVPTGIKISSQSIVFNYPIPGLPVSPHEKSGGNRARELCFKELTVFRGLLSRESLLHVLQCLLHPKAMHPLGMPAVSDKGLV